MRQIQQGLCKNRHWSVLQKLADSEGASQYGACIVRKKPGSASKTTKHGPNLFFSVGKLSIGYLGICVIGYLGIVSI